MLDFRINTFLAVCKYMNYTKASQELHITQPAVSQHIKFLEEEYNARLFEMDGRKLSLTNAGKVLLQTSIALKNDEGLLKQRMQMEDNSRIPLQFGVTMTIGEFVITKPLVQYIIHNPDRGIKLVMGNTKELMHELRAGRIQFAIVEGYFKPFEYDSMIFKEERFVAVCGKDYSFEKEPKRVADLLNEKLITREPGSGTRDILEKNLETRNLELDNFRSIYEIGNMNVIIELLKQNQGISFLYEAAVKKELKDGSLKIIDLEDFNFYHSFSFIWQRGSVLSDEYRRMCKELSKDILEEEKIIEEE